MWHRKLLPASCYLIKRRLFIHAVFFSLCLIHFFIFIHYASCVCLSFAIKSSSKCPLGREKLNWKLNFKTSLNLVCIINRLRLSDALINRKILRYQIFNASSAMFQWLFNAALLFRDLIVMPLWSQHRFSLELINENMVTK